MKVLGAAFVTLMKMRSSSALRSMCEERCAGTRSCAAELHESPCGSLAASPGVCREARIEKRRVHSTREQGLKPPGITTGQRLAGSRRRAADAHHK
jgi:hypothetical protein